MTRRLTKQEFVDKSEKVHGKAYDYSKVDYTSNSVKVSIRCVKHGSSFLQAPAKHMAGQGCPVCRYEKSSKGIALSTADFVASAKRVHGDAYNYDHTVYTGTHNLVKILCNTHGTCFNQKPVNHLSGGGCPLCAKEKVESHVQSLVLSTEEFVKKAKAVHGDLYDYDETVYKRSAGMVSIWCNRHGGYFQQTANNHLRGIGCASCAKTGYSTNKEGTLYILKCGDITKIGITNIAAETRATTISKKSGFKFTVVDTWEFDDGCIADNAETSILRILRSKYERPQARFEGSSECFLNVDYKDLLLIVDSELAAAQSVQYN